MTIRLYNTKTRRKEEFVPLVPGRVGMYLCGPTVYDRAHLGNARNVILFDVLFRLMRHEYGENAVTYVRNFTDVDDKINARAAETGRTIADITAETTRWYHDDMDALGALRPTHEPRATDHVGDMIAMIGRLIERGHAYEVSGHVLFDVRSYADYGKLSGRSVDDMIAGARVEVAPFKRDPMDFVLWKPSDPTLPGWDSPWGRGRPGWHIECSAMSLALLGAEFDIHGGGLDLQFPHHENEIAQSVCAHPGTGFAQLWLHNEMLLVEGKKMSKSLGNFFTVRDLLDKGVPGEVIRYVFLMTHYRSPMDWTADKLGQGERALRRWRSLFHGVSPTEPAPEFKEALSDDLNTAGALNFLGHLGQVLYQQNGSRWRVPHPGKRSAEWDRLASEFVASAQVLGLLEPCLGAWTETPDLHPLSMRLADLRATAMASRDFSQVDALKSALIAAGVEVRMSKSGVELVPGPGFDAEKLEALQ